MIVLTFAAVFILFRFQSSKSDTVEWNFDWEEANVRCKSQNDSLVTIQDIRSHRSLMVGHFPIWSSVKGTFTPWIAYRGCYEDGVCAGSSCNHLSHNTVGNCYFECKSKTKNDGGCANKEQFYFGLQDKLCKCFCEKNELQHISESTNCNVSCGQDINNGECGGETFYSMYEVTNVTLSHASFGGFCLTCRIQHGSIVLSSMDCDAKANGYCVDSNNSITPMDTNMSQFDAYWNRCKMQQLYIVWNTEFICQKRSMTIWTGLRKYDIERVRSNQTCYSIERNETIIGFRERNCTESLPFICKHHTDIYSTEKIESSKSTTPTIPSLDYSPTIEQTSTSKPVHLHVTSMTTSSSISSSSHIDSTPSTKLEGTSPTTIAGACIAGIVAAISVVILVFCFIKRRKLHCLQSEQQQAKRPNMFDNSTYNDLTVTNQRHNGTHTNTSSEYDNQESIGKIDDIYVEKEEEEYDHLHTSRQKHLNKDTKNNEYGTACYLEDNSYSTLGQSRNPEPDLDNGYSTMPSLENAGSSVANSEYDFCYQINQRKDW